MKLYQGITFSFYLLHCHSTDVNQLLIKEKFIFFVLPEVDYKS